MSTSIGIDVIKFFHIMSISCIFWFVYTYRRSMSKNKFYLIAAVVVLLSQSIFLFGNVTGNFWLQSKGFESNLIEFLKR